MRVSGKGQYAGCCGREFRLGIYKGRHDDGETLMMMFQKGTDKEGGEIVGCLGKRERTRW